MNTIVTWPSFTGGMANLFLNIYNDKGEYIKFIDLYSNTSTTPVYTAEEYEMCIVNEGGTILHHTTASTYEEVRQQYPELFL